jgi:hypothetical protein
MSKKSANKWFLFPRPNPACRSLTVHQSGDRDPAVAAPRLPRCAADAEASHEILTHSRPRNESRTNAPQLPAWRHFHVAPSWLAEASRKSGCQKPRDLSERGASTDRHAGSPKAHDCPAECEQKYAVPVLAAHLNDHHGWKRERIADFVEGIGY